VIKNRSGTAEKFLLLNSMINWQFCEQELRQQEDALALKSYLFKSWIQTYWNCVVSVQQQPLI